jgi:murein DD-endopeptidase MepM/ murein hydrolase activator NlpD
LGKTISIKIPLSWLHATAGVLVCAVLLVGSSFIYSAHLSRKLLNYGVVIAKNRQQQQVINSFASKTEQVNQALLELEKEDNNLRRMLGLKDWTSKIKLSSDIKGPLFSRSYGEADEELKQVDVQLQERKKSLAELKNYVTTVQQRLAFTPSRWPLYGQIVSRFGFRIFPWRGFHSGIDISANYGDPVRATADGVVSYAAWRTGYGKMVMIDHGHGLSTLYGHNSRYVVGVGQKVNKGQVICYVGCTGYTTGPHLHYEVKKGERAVNPIAYLDLNLLSACRVWGR